MPETSPRNFPVGVDPSITWGRIGVLALLGGLAMGLSILAVDPLQRTLLVAAGFGLCAVPLWLVAARRLDATATARTRAALSDFFEKDAAPGLIADGDGAVVRVNSAARSVFRETLGDTLAGTLRGIFVNPGAIVFRLQETAVSVGAAQEDVVTRRGHVRVSVTALGREGFFWRVEEMAERAQAGRNPDTLAVPMLTVGGSGAILFMNEAARGIAGARVKSLDRLFVRLPLRPGAVNMLSAAQGEVPVLVLENPLSASRREIFFLPAGAAAIGAATDIEHLPVAILKLSVAGRIVHSNPMADALLGGSVARNAVLTDLMEGLGRPLADWLADTAEGRSAPRSEVLRLRAGDGDLFVQLTLSRIEEDGTPLLLAVLSDATELKTLEAQFVQSQKMQAIGQLAGGVAHDFNNLLTAISGHCDLLLLRHDQGDEDFGDLMQINQNANRAAALVGQLLAFSRKQTLRPEILDMRDTLSDLTHLLNRLVGEKVTLTLSHDPVLGTIRADKRQMEQVLMNLVVNARDAMSEGGEIRIETEAVSLAEPLERDRARVPAGDYVSVKVEDDGEGITADKQQKIFEPFYTTKRPGEGTGLGLSTAYGIVKQTGGFIFVDSIRGAGTCFTLLFPVQADPVPSERVPDTPRPAAAAQHGEGVVLLVEDEAPVRAFASRALRLRGYTVIEASCAEEALETLRDDALAVDVFVTDVVMPGMDGPSWVRQALERRPDVRVVFVSGYAEGAFADASPPIPNSVFLPKPFSLNRLTETVHAQLH